MTETKKTITSIFIMLGAVVIFTAPLLHISFPKIPEYKVQFEGKIDRFNKVKNAELCNLKEELLLNKISPIDYIEQVELFEINREIEADLLNYQLDNLIDENRIFGFKSMRIFLIGFGIRLPYILFSFVILFFFLYSKEKLKKSIYLYRAIIILYSISFFISFYLIIWFLLPRDLPIPVYHILIGSLTILSTFTSIFLIKHYYNRKSNFLLAFKIKELIHFITKSRRTTLDIAVKASKADPKLKKDIKDKLVAYDKELSKTLRKVAN
ncbi:hypothetical protein [Aquimarina sp. RZ0]|uniref:hypothetical protein n=1 Tax=Aquimarina sp. RZ0 TaxID=2607730 RepID=UPI0011F2ED58|nr:hypothetical protein [Aquimarina sp. RZ0]KAA1243345.1 hypothetical protein F0000_21595 [Aquimarina sp. RZ0]